MSGRRPWAKPPATRCAIGRQADAPAVSTSAAVTLRELLRPPPSADGIDRKALAGLLVELARNVKPEHAPDVDGVPRVDLRLEELRQIVLGREIELLARLSAVVENPEQLAAAVGRILTTAVAHATGDERLGHVTHTFD